MLQITTNKSSSGLINYLRNNLMIDDYYLGAHGEGGKWYGKLRDKLRLSETVMMRDFISLAENEMPGIGTAMTRGNGKGRRVSYEFCFSAPKSFSLIREFANDEEKESLLELHEDAVRFAMAAVESDIHCQVKVMGKNTYARTGNMIYAMFTHKTSRPVKELDSELARYSADMNIHSHCVAMAITHFEDRYKAIEISPTWNVADYYQNLYHSYLSKNLQVRGYTVDRTKERWEISAPGLKKETLDKFSRRTKEVESLAKKLGITDEKSKAKLAATSRIHKSKLKPNTDLKRIWMNKLTPKELKAVTQAKGNIHPSPNKINVKQAVDMALDHYLEKQSTAPVKKVLAHTLALGYGKIGIKEIIHELKCRDNILYGDRRSIKYLTTREMVKKEDEMIDICSEGKNTRSPINLDYKFKFQMLNDAQKKAIKHVLTSKDKVMVISGAAGSGKSTLLEEISIACKQSGKNVIALAPTASASRGVLREKGMSDADTIARFLKDKTLQKKTKNQILIVDEAGLVGVGQMLDVLKIAKENKTRVVLSGDVLQHSSPNYGDAARLIIEKSNLKVAHVKTILRQRANPEYQKAIAHLADGRIGKGFDQLDQMSSVLEYKEVEDRFKQIAKDYVGSLERKRSALVIAPTHKEGELLTEYIRSEMKSRGRLKGRDRVVNVQKALRMTEALKQDHVQYERGQLVQFHQNVRGGFKAGFLFEVVGKSKKNEVIVKHYDSGKSLILPLNSAKHFQVFKRGELNIAGGDIIRITVNGKTKEGTRIHNGDRFMVRGFDKCGDIKLSNGKTLDQKFGHIALGHVITSHSSQGKDCRDVFISQSTMSMAAITAKTFYVSASRAKETIKLYTDDKDALRKAVMSMGNRMSAGEVLEKHRARIRQRKRQRYYEHLINRNSKDERSKQKPKPKDKVQKFER